MSTFLVMASRMLRLSWRAACFSNRFCHPKFSSNTKEGLLFTGALAVPVDNLNRRFRCNRSLISCKQFTAINIHSQRAAVFGSVPNLRTKEKAGEKESYRRRAANIKHGKAKATHPIASPYQATHPR